MSLVVVGTVAFDAIETPFGKEVLRQKAWEKYTIVSTAEFAGGLYYYFYTEGLNAASGCSA